MKKLSESVWMDIHKRSNGEAARREDPLECAFIKAKEMELIDVTSPMHSGRKTLWTPCNLGAESYDEPGLWLDYNQIAELHSMLKNTGYYIASSFDWDGLRTVYGKSVKIKDKTYGFLFADKLYIPNFGYMSSLDKPLFTKRNDGGVYGSVLYDVPSYTVFHFTMDKTTYKIGSFRPATTMNDQDSTDKFQVRLVKRVS